MDRSQEISSPTVQCPNVVRNTRINTSSLSIPSHRVAEWTSLRHAVLMYNRLLRNKSSQLTYYKMVKHTDVKLQIHCSLLSQRCEGHVVGSRM